LSTTILYAILAGIFTAAESCMMSRLGRQITPSVATMYGLATGFVGIAIFRLIRGASTRTYFKVFSVSPVYAVGGILGAAIIYLSAKAIPVLGIPKTLTVIVASQILAGLVIDYLVHQQSFNGRTVLGVLLLLAGVYLIVK
jgi:transporter family-2 protein